MPLSSIYNHLLFYSDRSEMNLNHQNLQRPCWNGPDCYYLSQNRCHFYHPPEHLQGFENSSDSDDDVRISNRYRPV